MRALQGTFARLKEPLSASSKGYNRVLIALCLHLFNLRAARLPAFHQIKTVFDSD